MSSDGTWANGGCWPRVIAGFVCLGILVFQKCVWGRGLSRRGSACQELGVLGNQRLRGIGNGERVPTTFWFPVKVLLVND